MSLLLLLGETFTANLTSDAHVKHIVKKYYRILFLFRNLIPRPTHCLTLPVNKCYILFIRSLLLHSYSRFCNLHDYCASYLFQRLLQVEFFFLLYKYSGLCYSADDLCQSLFWRIHGFVDLLLRSFFPFQNPNTEKFVHFEGAVRKEDKILQFFIRFERQTSLDLIFLILFIFSVLRESI